MQSTSDLRNISDKENIAQIQSEQKNQSLDIPQAVIPPSDAPAESTSNEAGPAGPTEASKVRSRIIREKFFDNGAPSAVYSHADRKFLEIEPFNGDAHTIKGRYNSKKCEELCVFCLNAENEEKDELIGCEGEMESTPIGLERESIACKSRFHVSCAMRYNASGFLLQYSALPECQNKLLCPLHACSCCNGEGYKQVAYEDVKIECALCLRSFHHQWCVPSGSKPIDAFIEVDGKVLKFEMIICPSHKETKHIPLSHIKSCDDCLEKKNLIKCQSCCRSFHQECQDLKKVNGLEIPKDQCEKCASGDTIRYDVPVLARWDDGAFYLAMTRDWYSYPMEHRSEAEHYERVGFVVVEYISSLKKIPEAQRQFSIVPVGHVAPIVEGYYATAPNAMTRKIWRTIAEKTDIYSRLPVLYKKVREEIKSSFPMEGTVTKVQICQDTDFCECTEESPCSSDDCAFFAAEHECPKNCHLEKKCENRKISKKFVNPKMKLKKTQEKGFGVFAKEAISKGEFLAEYAGEIINRAEKERRREFCDKSRDYQANHYIMDLGDGLSVDAARYGNITRYVNHSCSPNAIAYWKMVQSRGDAKSSKNRDCLKYERRLFLETIKEISQNEEITFNYGMEGSTLPKCKCNSENCIGVMSDKLSMVEDEEKAERRNTSSHGETSEKKKKSMKRKSSTQAPQPRAKQTAGFDRRRSTALKIQEEQ